jgi:anaerobic glycerol-3-phosphate dehydrogenase
MPLKNVVSYVRDMTVASDKFAAFDRLCREARPSGAEAVLVTGPEVLGDDYAELVANLNKLADADLPLVIVPTLMREGVRRN